jgi:glycosyltransferase involved in cell wall biosynthesis
MPKVSVIIPTYNCAEYITQAIKSVLDQTYQDFELIVIDDGSTDNTRALLEPYLGSIIYRFQKNQGESVARNEGIEIAQGKYIAFLDADDWWVSSKLEQQVAAMDASPEAVLSYSYCFMVDAQGGLSKFRGSQYLGEGETGLSSVFERLVLGCCIANPGTVLVRKDILQQTTLFDPTIQWGEDWDLWIQLSQKGLFLFIPESLAYYRMRKPNRRLQIEASDEFVNQNEKILSKEFNSIPPYQRNLQALRSKAYEALYLRSAMYNYELNDNAKGASYIQKAFSVSPDLYQNMYPLAKLIADIGVRIMSEKNMNSTLGTAFIGNVFDHLPVPLQKRWLYHLKALSEFHMAVAFTQFGLKRHRSTVNHVARALLASPGNIKNLGLVSIALQSIFGKKIWKKPVSQPD